MADTIDVNPEVDSFFSHFDKEDSDSSSEEKDITEDDKTSDVEGTDTKENKETEEKEAKDTTDVGDSDEEDSKDVPFHKHPRFKELIREKNELKEARKNWEKEKAEMQEKLENAKYQELSDEELAEMSPQEIIEHTKETLEKEREFESKRKEFEKKEADQYIDDTLQELKDAGNEFDEPKLLKLSVDFTGGDILKAHELYQRLEKTEEKGANKQAKEAARKREANANTSNKSSPSSKSFVRGTSWDSLELT